MARGAGQRAGRRQGFGSKKERVQGPGGKVKGGAKAADARGEGSFPSAHLASHLEQHPPLYFQCSSLLQVTHAASRTGNARWPRPQSCSSWPASSQHWAPDFCRAGSGFHPTAASKQTGSLWKVCCTEERSSAEVRDGRGRCSKGMGQLSKWVSTAPPPPFLNCTCNGLTKGLISDVSAILGRCEACRKVTGDKDPAQEGRRLNKLYKALKKLHMAPAAFNLLSTTERIELSNLKAYVCCCASCFPQDLDTVQLLLQTRP